MEILICVVYAISPNTNRRSIFINEFWLTSFLSLVILAGPRKFLVAFIHKNNGAILRDFKN